MLFEQDAYPNFILMGGHVLLTQQMNVKVLNELASVVGKPWKMNKFQQVCLVKRLV